MNDKVNELKKILENRNKAEMKNNHSSEQNQDEFMTTEEFETQNDDQQEVNPNNPQDQDSQNEIEQLKNKIEELEAAAVTQKDMYLRQVAEFDNTKKRLKKEQDELAQYANEKLIMELLPVFDNLTMALEHAKDASDPVVSGVELTLKQLKQAFEKFNVQEITGENETFNPNCQEAISTQEAPELGSGKVIKVLRKGYLLGNKVLRAALVIVSN